MSPNIRPTLTESRPAPTDTAPETIPTLAGLDSHHDSAIPLDDRSGSDTPVGGTPTVPQRPPVIPGYADLKLIGRGVTGTVYSARQVTLNRTVALKVLCGPAFTGPDALARFQAEARAVGAIYHPNVIQVYDIGEGLEAPYIAAEFVEGGTLEQRLAAGPLTVPEAVRLVYHIARGVSAAHASGILHRDLKPANILLATPPSETPPPGGRHWTDTSKVADFGLAMRMDGNAVVSGQAVGTPAYMAPEQAAGQSGPLSPRTDVYALGAILYHCLTGRPPHLADTAAETLEKVRYATPLPVSHFRRDVPDDLESLVTCCLRANPDQRYPTADAVAEELARLAVGWRRAKLLAAARAETRSGTALGLVAVFAVIAALVLFGFYLANESGWFAPTAAPTARPEPVALPTNAHLQTP